MAARRAGAGGAGRAGAHPTATSPGWDAPHTLIDIVNDDMPFLVDSILMAIDRHDLGIHLVVHPVIGVRRDANGDLLEVAPGPVATAAGGAINESWVHVEVDRETSAEILDAVRADIERVLADNRAATNDWLKMLAAVDAVDNELDRNPPPVDTDELDEGRALLRWMAAQHFTFLGYRRYDLDRDADGGDVFRAVPDSGLGILRRRDGASDDARASDSFSRLPAEIRAKARERTLLVLTKANARHRAPPDVSRLRRREALRRRGQRDRRAPLPGALRVVGVHREPDRHPGAPPQGGGGDHALGVRAREPRLQEPHRDPRELSP